MRLAVVLVLAAAAPAAADRILAREGDRLVEVDSDGKQHRVLDLGIRVLDAWFGPGGALVLQDYDWNLYLGDKDHRIASGQRVAFAPDGKRIAFGCDVDASTLDATALCVVALDGTGLQRLHAGAAHVAPLGWSADGARVVFAAFKEDDTTVFEVAPGEAPRARLEVHGSRGGVALSPDGRRFAWGEGGKLHIRPVDGGAEKTIRVANLSYAACAWSPDSTRLACVFTRKARGGAQSSSVEVLEVDRGALHALEKHGNGAPLWSPDGERVLYQYVDMDDSWPALVVGWKGGKKVKLQLRMDYEDAILTWGR